MRLAQAGCVIGKEGRQHLSDQLGSRVGETSARGSGSDGSGGSSNVPMSYGPSFRAACERACRLYVCGRAAASTRGRACPRSSAVGAAFCYKAPVATPGAQVHPPILSLRHAKALFCMLILLSLLLLSLLLLLQLRRSTAARSFARSLPLASPVRDRLTCRKRSTKAAGQQSAHAFAHDAAAVHSPRCSMRVCRK